MTVGTMPKNAYPKDAVLLAVNPEEDSSLDASADGGELWRIPIDRIDVDVDNHRLRRDEDKIRELAKTIDRDGLQQPIRIYHQGQSDPKKVRFTLGFGFRRLAAHQLLKRTTIRAFVFQPAEEGEIRAAQAIENLHRVDLTPLEEATACQALLDSIDGGLEQVAQLIGRPRRWIEARLGLLRLSPRVQKMLEEGLIYLGHAQLIARIAAQEDQEEVAGCVAAVREAHYISGFRKGDMRQPSSIADTRRLVEQKLRTLHGVPWRMDAEFAGKPACSACPENTANAPGLFDGDAPKKSMCLNAACYKEKTKAASSAVARASNTLVKMTATAVTGRKDSAPRITPANARKAIDEREVGFIEPKAVTAAAKRKADPKKKTSAEKRGSQQRSQQDEAQEAYREALAAWRAKFDDRAIPLLRNDAWRVAMLVLLTHTEPWHARRYTGRRGHKQAKKRVEPYLRGLAETTDAKRLELLWKLINELEIDPGGYAVDDAINDALSDEAFWLEVFPDVNEGLPPMPKLEDFKPAAAPKSKTTKKKPAKKKPAKKKRTGRKKTRRRKTTPRKAVAS